MDTKDYFRRCLEQATRIVNLVRAQDFTNATPDTEWDVKTLVNHMLYEASWIPDVVAGKTVAEVGDTYEGDLFNEDLQGSWQEAVEHAHQAVQDADLSVIAHVSYSSITLEDYIKEVATDLLIHAWDLGEGIGEPVSFDPEVAQAAYDYTIPRQDTLAQSGLYAPPVDVPEDADIQTKLLALTGRSST